MVLSVIHMSVMLIERIMCLSRLNCLLSVPHWSRSFFDNKFTKLRTIVSRMRICNISDSVNTNEEITLPGLCFIGEFDQITIFSMLLTQLCS